MTETTRMTRTARYMFAVLAALTVLLAACSSDEKASTDTTSAGKTLTGTITVSAAASLTEPFTMIAEDFKAANPGVSDVKLNFDASGTLAKQIQEGASADVFASADEANMAKVTDAGLADGEPLTFARNKLAIVVKKGNPHSIKSLEDLASGIMVSLCGSDVPCGKYADQVLGNAGVTIPADKITRGQNVKTTFGAVANGDADAGIVYATDITGDITGDEVESIAIPDDINAIAVYPITLIDASTNKETAQAFVDFVMSEEGQATLREFGFMSPK